MTEFPWMVRTRSQAVWTPEEDDLLIKRFASGRDPRELARLHGRELVAIQTRLRALGLIQTAASRFPAPERKA